MSDSEDSLDMLVDIVCLTVNRGYDDDTKARVKNVIKLYVDIQVVKAEGTASLGEFKRLCSVLDISVGRDNEVGK